MSGRPVLVRPGPPRSRPAKASILAWRDRLSTKYRPHLGADLVWDEEGAFERSEDVATGADMLFRYVAAVLDRHGLGAIRALAGTPRPSDDAVGPVFDEAVRRGFAGRFPQLLLGAQHWFPFRRHMIIEEPNWDGDVERYGSLFRLADEVHAIRAAIADADPAATAWTAERQTPQDDLLAAAWQAGNTVSRFCAVALDRHLPLRTRG